MQIYEYGHPDAAIVLIQPIDSHNLEMIEKEYTAIQAHSSKDFHLIAVMVANWNSDLSPWKAPPVFGKEGFGESASTTLSKVLEICTDRNKTYCLGGYSLAGLFALWAAYQTDLFRGIAAASPSVWFPGFTEYMKTHKFRSSAVYLSLGDKEEKVKNPVIAAAGDRIRESYDCLRNEGLKCLLEWNKGSHFTDVDFRCAKAFVWVIEQLYSSCY